MWHRGISSVAKALLVAAAAAGAYFALYTAEEAGWFDWEGRTVTSNIEGPLVGCTSRKNLDAVKRMASQDDSTGILLMIARGYMGDGCIPIHPGSKVIYFGDPYRRDYVRAYVPGYPDKVLVPSMFIRKMLEKNKK